MKTYSANEIRNIVILGHSGCGKTTVAEAALNAGGVTSRLGRVEDGNTVSDYDAEEIRRKVSISAAILPMEWRDSKINFIDAPGYFDFAGEVAQAIKAADAALIVVSAKSGVEVGTEKAWEYVSDNNLPAIIFVNGMDDENADFAKVTERLKDKFGTSVAPLQTPIIEGGKFVGAVNIIRKEAIRGAAGQTQKAPMPDGMAEAVDAMQYQLEEAVAETDDKLMEKFFGDERFEVEELRSGVHKGILDRAVTPVLCGCASKNIGVEALLNSIVSFIPPTGVLRAQTSAEDVKSGGRITVNCADNEPFSAFVFKTIADPYVGRLSIFRVFSGVMTKDMPLYNVKKDYTEKAGHIYVMRGKEQIEVSELRAGDIGAVAKLQNTATSDTLCARERPVKFDDIVFPPSFLSMAITPKGKGDEDKIGQALSKLLEEDKTLHFEVNSETKQSIVSGVGDSHLDVMLSKLRMKYKLEAELATPSAPYREMIKSKVRVQGKYKKQSGGHGQYGDVHIEFEPSGDLTEPYVFEEKIFGGSVPRQYFPAVEKGIQDCVKSGPLAGYPVVGVKATLVDGSYHPVDSSEMAFKMATIAAFKDGFLKAQPTLLEPIAKVEVVTPDDYTGDIMGDMSKRRGRILGMGKTGSKQRISAEAPMAELSEYATDLRSMTQARGEFTMAFERYEEAPGDVRKKIIEARKSELERERA
ncbi:MAG: elongation factor G [Clostridiales bacterium]|jgi:elongation factor G|nr:elongation factor G [Clostridiales bacterium]